MWIRNIETKNEFEIEDESLLKRCLASGEFEEIEEPVAPAKRKAGGKNADNS